MDSLTNTDEQILKYDNMTRPYLEQFISNNVINSLAFNLKELFLKPYIKLSLLFSDNFLYHWKAERVLKSIQKKNIKDKKLKIKKIVESYKHNFLKFNFGLCSFEQANDKFQKNSQATVYSREMHKTITNRNIQKHWK